MVNTLVEGARSGGGRCGAQAPQRSRRDRETPQGERGLSLRRNFRLLVLEFGVRVSYSSNDIVFVVIHYKHLTVRDERSEFLYA